VAGNSELVARELTRLKTAYFEATGLEVLMVPRRLGVTTGGEIDIETGQILVWDDNPPAFQDGYVSEELHHYFQLDEKGLIGEGATLTAEEERDLEADVVACSNSLASRRMIPEITPPIPTCRARPAWREAANELPKD